MKKGSTLKAEIARVQNLTPPKQYQQGWTEFYKLKFYLTPDVLIPRPETELLVDGVIKIANSKLQIAHSKTIRYKPSAISILDVGTGSGCIAISIAKNLPDVKILATDISDKALGVAQLNAKFHNVEDQIIFLKVDLLPDFKQPPDVIVTNLPYIPTARLMYIDPMVTEFEPRVALDGGRDGFELYRKLFAQLASQLRVVKLKPKYLFGEIDYTHGELAVLEALRYFPNSKPEVILDLAKKQRILKIKF